MTALGALILSCGLTRGIALLEAIVRIESAGNAVALHVNGPLELVRQPRDVAEASRMAHWLSAHGYNFDAGLAQLNSANLDRLGLDTSSVFKPCANLRAASRVLQECFERARQRPDGEARVITAALSCYNTGDFTRGVKNGYVTAVQAAARSLARQAIAKSSARTARPQRPEPRFPATRRASKQVPSDAPRRPEAFAMARADAFGASSREESAR